MSRTSEKPKMTEDGFIIVYSKDDVPEFENEAEEAAFWDTHTWSEEIMREAAKEPRDPDLPAPREPVRSSHISLHLEADTLLRLKNLARKKGKGYQTLLKEFVIERLYEEEKREGMI
jgi:uncharacterized protein (DUF4415 family)